MNATEILRRRLDSLLQHAGRTRKDFAIYLGKQPSWSTEFFQGRHGMTLNDLDRAARFFGLSLSDLFQIDGHKFRDRRRTQRRSGHERRAVGRERRKTP